MFSQARETPVLGPRSCCHSNSNKPDFLGEEPVFSLIYGENGLSFSKFVLFVQRKRLHDSENTQLTVLAVLCGGKHGKEVFAGSTALAAPSELLACGCFAPHFWACTETERIMVEALGRGNLTAGGNGRGTGRARAAYVPQGCSQGATSFSQVSL